jgi:hypothetical protein
MGIKYEKPSTFIIQLMRALVGLNSNGDSKDDTHAAIDRLDPKPSIGGLFGVRGVGQCECGEPHIFQCSSADVDEVRKNHEEQIESGSTVLVQMAPKGAADDAPEIAAMNHGATTNTCTECGRVMFVHWSLEVLTVAPGVKVPDSQGHDQNADTGTHPMLRVIPGGAVH